MSSENADEKTARRKSKVSPAMLISGGLVEPKLRPKGVGDGQQGKIFLHRLSCVISSSSDAGGYVIDRLNVIVRILSPEQSGREIRGAQSTERVN